MLQTENKKLLTDRERRIAQYALTFLLSNLDDEAEWVFKPGEAEPKRGELLQIMGKLGERNE